MNKCPECGKELEDSAVFCSKCGTKLSVTCPKCGKVLKSGAKFCSVCGTNLAEPSKPADSPNYGEEKHNLNDCSLCELLNLEDQSHSAEVQLELAKRYYRMNTAQDRKVAVEWYKKSAEQGNDRAQSNFGDCYFNGWGTDEDKKEAFKWYKKAAAQGNKYAEYQLTKF